MPDVLSIRGLRRISAKESIVVGEMLAGTLRQLDAERAPV